MTDEQWIGEDQIWLDDQELPDAAPSQNAQRDPRTGSPQRPLTAPPPACLFCAGTGRRLGRTSVGAAGLGGFCRACDGTGEAL